MVYKNTWEERAAAREARGEPREVEPQASRYRPPADPESHVSALLRQHERELRERTRPRPRSSASASTRT